MIGIIGAMEEEVAAIKEYMHITDTKNILDCIFYQGMIENKEVVLLQGGVGKVNAAICTTLLLTNYQIDMVINIGSAGGLCLKQEVGDIVISNEVCQYDFDKLNCILYRLMFFVSLLFQQAILVPHLLIQYFLNVFVPNTLSLDFFPLKPPKKDFF